MSLRIDQKQPSVPRNREAGANRLRRVSSRDTNRRKTPTRLLPTLPRISLSLKKNFRQATKQDVVKLMAELEAKDLEELMKHTYRAVSKKFFQWLYKMDEKNYLSQVARIHTRLTNKSLVLPEELLTLDDIKSFLAAA